MVNIYVQDIEISPQQSDDQDQEGVVEPPPLGLSLVEQAIFLLTVCFLSYSSFS